MSHRYVLSSRETERYHCLRLSGLINDKCFNVRSTVGPFAMEYLCRGQKWESQPLLNLWEWQQCICHFMYSFSTEAKSKSYVVRL